ncbi:MAG: hypothetical protein N4A61_03725 [Pelagimonas sp.]|nr:hypothetical protein [Pelagimonas sp.]
MFRKCRLRRGRYREATELLARACAEHPLDLSIYPALETAANHADMSQTYKEAVARLERLQPGTLSGAGGAVAWQGPAAA